MVAASTSVATHPLSLATLVERRLRELVTVHDGVTYGPVHGVTLAPRKRVRAALALASARAVELAERIAIELAAGIELIHTCSLVHDDIQHAADTRHGLPTVHVVEGTPIAINALNAVHALGWSVMLDLDAPPERTLNVVRVFALTLERMAAGQARDLLWARGGRRDLRYSEYAEMVRCKTGALLGFAAAAPAALAGHAGAAALYQFGEELGIVCHLVDDVANLRSSRKGPGSSVAARANRTVSAPALLATEHCDGTARTIELAHEHCARACAHLRRTGIADTSELSAFTELLLE